MKRCPAVSRVSCEFSAPSAPWPDGGEGFLSAEEWLLHDWEHMMRRKMMVIMEKVVREMVDHLDLDLPAEDVHAYIKGPAIVVDAVALY